MSGGSTALAKVSKESMTSKRLSMRLNGLNLGEQHK